MDLLKNNIVYKDEMNMILSVYMIVIEIMSIKLFLQSAPGYHEVSKRHAIDRI